MRFIYYVLWCFNNYNINVVLLVYNDSSTYTRTPSLNKIKNLSYFFVIKPRLHKVFHSLKSGITENTKRIIY